MKEYAEHSISVGGHSKLENAECKETRLGQQMQLKEMIMMSGDQGRRDCWQSSPGVE
jgi:hypothetical protein